MDDGSDEEEEEEDSQVNGWERSSHDSVEIVEIDLTETVQPTTSSISEDPFERQVEALFIDRKTSKINPYWKESLLQLTRPSARSLVPQLTPDCPLGFDPAAIPLDPLLRRSPDAATSATPSTAGKKGSFLAFCREQKKKYPDCILLCRCGDFYETFGIDALMMIEHCGLNPMGSKAKAGCPVRNVQATIDGLTQQGFRVAVYEEAADTDAANGAASGGSKARLKSRFLAQIVSAASPTYLYDLLLLGSSADSISSAPPARPFCGVISMAAGYTLVEVSWEERTVKVSERLTTEAVACRLAAYPPADPLFYIPSANEADQTVTHLPFLPSQRELSCAGYGAKLRTQVLSPNFLPTNEFSETERAKRIVVQAVLSLADSGDNDGGHRTTADDFTLVSTPETTFTNPLYVETATQLGLLQDRTIPPLLSYILPDSAPAATKRFLRRLLLTPPPPSVADALALLVTFAKERGPALPALNVPPIGKVLSLLRAGQASAHVYGELLQTLASNVLVLETLSDREPEVVDALMTLLEYESGLAGDPESLRLRCLEAIEKIEAIVSPLHHAKAPSQEMLLEDAVSDFGDCIPRAFLERNEMVWRGRVRPDAMRTSYDRVIKAAAELAQAVEQDFWLGKVGEGKNLIAQDVFNNIFALKAIPEGASDPNMYIHPRDRFGKVLRNRYTTERVQTALSSYVAASDHACRDVASALASLSQQLHEEGHMPAIVQASHSNLVLSSALHHAARANTLGWERAEVYNEEESQGDSGLHIRDLWPYWMDKKEAVGNNIDMQGIFLMTAPNMSGKSTLMRSTAAAALLSVCGLCAPLQKGSRISRFDHLFVRGASADVPSENKSAFGAEMGDVAALLRSCGRRSLVFVDELGRGTSPRDGTRLAGAVLEAMSMAGMKGIFATHLHEILDLPLKGKERIVPKRMAIHDVDETGDESEAYRWTYRLEDGVCRDSMALVTAARFGLPEAVLARAEALGEHLSGETTCSPAGSGEKQRHEKGSPSQNALNELVRLFPVVRQVVSTEPITIPPLWSSPSSLEGRSCLYILELDENPPRFYVGETDKLSKRIGQHRAKGGPWSTAAAVVIPASSKSEAREWESRVIRKLAKAGVDLVSSADGRRDP